MKGKFGRVPHIDKINLDILFNCCCNIALLMNEMLRYQRFRLSEHF